MKISYKWISEFFGDTKALEVLKKESSMLQEQLPFLGLEVASHETQGKGLEKVIVAQILELEKHPQADKLNVCQVDAGGKEPLQIVCGAPNARKEMKVALAPVGSILPGDFAIKPAKIRGVESFGMLCSGTELGFPDDGSSGILDLDQSLPIGSKIIEALSLDDEILEVELTPDRADCLSHLGMAREIARLIGRKVSVPEFEDLSKSLKDVPLFSVEVQAEDVCPIYAAVLIEGIENNKTPAWMQSRLESLGVSTHDALVDITNYVLHEFGHPLHAFDADKITGSKIIVRYAKDSEKLTTLDDQELVLTTEDLIIADSEKPLALAGVMGGLDSGVTENTKRIILESAVFDATVIRKMAARHKIHSDASHRFERGVDPNNSLRAAGRASKLYKEITEGRRRGAIVEVTSKSAQNLRTKSVLNFDLRAFYKLVGIEADAETITKLFNEVELETQIKSPNVLRVEIPTNRIDLLREVDLIEEASRLLGYDKIPELYPTQTSQSVSLTQPLQVRLSRLRERILDTGLCEAMPYCFISDKTKKVVPYHAAVELENPLSQDWKYLRPNLTFGLIDVLKHHVGSRQNEVEVFDIGHTFTKRSPEESAENKKEDQRRTSGVQESYHFAWAQMGHSYSTHWSNDKKTSDRKQLKDYFDARGVFDKLLPDLAALEGRWSSCQFVSLESFLENESWKKLLESEGSWIPVDILHPTRTAILVWPGKPPGTIVGWIGEIHPQHKADWLNLPTGLNIGVAMGEVRFSADIGKEMENLQAGKNIQTPQPYGKISTSGRTPVVERDISLVFKPETKASDIEKTLNKSMGKLLKQVECLDLYPMDEGKKSLAYRLYLQDDEATLKDDAIQASVKTGVDALVKEFGAELRS